MPAARPLAALLAGALLAAAPAWAADTERGRLLHETFCGGCHDRSVAQRPQRSARSYAELRAQVVRWQQNAGYRWEPQDIEDVAAHLNAAYYRFPAP